ncbi:MAG: hypothetical protein ACI9W6_003090 [Motiliproteus sp.]|jgi:hypothetical protein
MLALRDRLKKARRGTPSLPRQLSMLVYALHRCTQLSRSGVVAAVVLVQLGCSVLPQSPLDMQTSTPDSTHLTDACPLLLQRLARRIQVSDGADPLGYPIATYPYLRVNRLLASFSKQLNTQARQQAWYQRLYRLGKDARQVELDNLSPAVTADTREQLERCIEQRASRDLQAKDVFAQLTRRAQVPDLYSDWQRALGLFPLTRQIVLRQIASHQQRWRQQFNSPALLQGPSRLYQPPLSKPLETELISSWLEQARNNNPLGLPELDSARQLALFRHFAPLWQSFTHSSADLIGRPQWRDGAPDIDTNDPVTYLLPSYTRFNGQILLQLNYMAWFPERPSQRPLDLYAGPLDGLIWRVTLDADGRVLLYDSIHPCGCYHLIFPVAKGLSIKPPDAAVEQPLILSGIAPGREQGRLVLQLTPEDHYLQGIALADERKPGAALDNQSLDNPALDNKSDHKSDNRRRYRFDSYHQLRSLATADGRRNLFDPDGLVGATARLERFLLWPMGVNSPGAMRVWGAHAIGFANRRYFDDPQLFEQFFE